MARKKIHWRRVIFWLIPAIFLAVFYFYPLIRVADRSFLQHGAIPRFDPAHVRTGWRAVQFSFTQAFVSVMATLALGLPAAYLFGRFKFPGRNFLRISATLPFILPTVVVAAGFNALLGENGWLNQVIMRIFDLSFPPIQLFGTLGAIILAHVFYNTSIFIRVVGTAWERLGRSYENAARILAASPWEAFVKITFPLLRPSIISALLLVFLFDLTSFGVILLMGGARFATMEVEIYIQTTQFLNLKLAGLLALIQLLFSIGLTLLGRYFDNTAFTPLMAVSSDEVLRQPGKVWEKLFVAGSALLLSLLTITPILALLLKSFTFPSGGRQLAISFSNFQNIFINERDALFFVPPFIAVRNSLLYGFSAMLISVLIGIMVVFSSQRSRRTGKWMDILIMLPLGTSAVTLGLGYLLAFSGSRKMVTFYPILIPIAHALIALPFVVRILQPALNAIPENQHHAAVMLGIPRDKLWWKLDLPIIRRAVMTSAIYAFAISLGEFGATTFLARPDIPTLPVAIFRYLGLPGAENYGKGMAMAVILLLACSAGFILIENLQKMPEMD